VIFEQSVGGFFHGKPGQCGFQAIQIQDFGAQVIDEFADCLTGVV